LTHKTIALTGMELGTSPQCVWEQNTEQRK